MEAVKPLCEELCLKPPLVYVYSCLTRRYSAARSSNVADTVVWNDYFKWIFDRKCDTTQKNGNPVQMIKYV